MSFLAIAGCAFGAYVAFWAIYLPVAYIFNKNAEHDPDDDAVPPWLAELEYQEPVPTNGSNVRHGVGSRLVVRGVETWDSLSTSGVARSGHIPPITVTRLNSRSTVRMPSGSKPFSERA
jgi:hypothetical protein